MFFSPALRHSLIFAFLLFAFAAPCPAADAPAAKRPNILFLFSDDQRADTIAALGNDRIKTPHLDRLAREGAAMTRTYCMGAMQGAVCVPSRAMLMTGRTLFRVDSTLMKQPTWPEQFAQAGYATFATGKWHNGQDSLRKVFQEGNHLFFGGMTDPYQATLHNLTPDRTFAKVSNVEKHSVESFADSAIAFLKRQKADQPFLCYVAFNLPHDPKTCPPEYYKLYDAASMPLPANYLPHHPFNYGEMSGRDEQLEAWPRTPEAIRRHVAEYYACITYLDAQIGRILETLRETGQFENTIIVFTSDHGLTLGSHGLMGKQNLYDDAMHSPFLIRGPGIPQGQNRDAMCYLLDIFPTLGELCGIPAPEGSEGLSFAGVLAEKSKRTRDSIFTAYTTVQRAVRDDRWKLLVYPQVNKTQLFDLQTDPHERTDLAADSRHAGEIERLTKLLKAWQEKSGDKQPLTVADPQPLPFDFAKIKRNTNPGNAGKKSK